MEVDIVAPIADNNTQTKWQGSVGSTGGAERGEHNINIFGVPERSYRSLYGNVLSRPRKRDRTDDG